MLRALIPLALATAACTPTERPAEPVAAPAIALPTPAVSEPSTEAPSLLWRWQSRGPVDAVGRDWGPEIYELSYGPHPIRVNQGDELRVSRDGEVPWSTVVGKGQSNHGAAVVNGASVFVAHFHALATGAKLARLDLADGSLTWDRYLVGAGPIGHSKYHGKYASDVQVDVVGDRLHVFGWESGGAYTEVVSLTTGEQAAHRAAPADLVAMPWSWTGDRDDWDGPNSTLAVASYGDIELTGGVAKLPGGAEVRLSDHDGSMPTGAAVLHDGTLFIAHGSAISSGASLSAVSTEDGQLRWTTPLWGIGPTAHSEYFNELQLSVHHGMVVVYGNEANGRYLEAVDPETGEAVVNKSWPL